MGVTEELSRLHMRDTFRPKSAKHLTKEQNQDALEYLMFLKVKWDVKAKGQICVDGRKQRKNVVPVEATSPTVSTESILITEKLMGMRDTTLGYSTSRLIFSVQTWTRT